MNEEVETQEVDDGAVENPFTENLEAANDDLEAQLAYEMQKNDAIVNGEDPEKVEPKAAIPKPVEEEEEIPKLEIPDPETSVDELEEEEEGEIDLSKVLGEETEEEEEEGGPNPVTDPEGWINHHFKGKKTGELRKTLSIKEAQIQTHTARIEELQTQVSDFEQNIEQQKQEEAIKSTDLKSMDINDYGPIKDLQGEFHDKLNRIGNRLSKSSHSTYLQQNALRLIEHVEKMRGLDGDEFDQANENLDAVLEKEFGSRHANKVRDFLDDGLEMLHRNNELTQEFNEKQGELTAEYHTNVYTDTVNQISESLPKLWEVTDEEVASDPMSFRSLVHEFSKTNPDQFKKMLAKDQQDLVRLQAGDKPFNPNDSQWRGMQPEQAKQAYAKQVKETEKFKAQNSLDLAAMGLMAIRFIPALRKKAAGGVAKKSNAPKPKSGGKPTKASKAPMSLEDELAQSSAEASKLISKF